MGRSRDVANALGKLPEFIPLIEALGPQIEQYGPTNQAQIDARISGPASPNVGAGQALMGGVNLADSGNGSKTRIFRNPTPTDLMSRRSPTDYRYISDMLRDAGEAIEGFMSPSAPLDHYAAFNRAVVEKSCTRLLLNRPSYYFRTSMGSGLRNMVFVAGANAGGRPTVIFEDEIRAMIDLGPDVEYIRFEGHWIIGYRDTPATSAVYGLLCNGCRNVSFDRLTILNSLGGVRFVGATSNVHIRQLDLPAGAPFSTASTVSNIQIDRLTGGNPATIGAGHDVKIGVQLPAILSGIAALTASANKHIRFNASAVPVLDDWIEAAPWNPVLSAATPGDLNTAGITTSGTYYKRGRDLILYYNVIGAPIYTSASGALQIGGVPVLFAGGLAQALDAPNVCPPWGWPGTATTDFFSAPAGSQNYFQFVAGKSGSGRSTAQIGMWPSGTNYSLRGVIRAQSLT